MHPLDRRLTAAEWSALRWSPVATAPFLVPTLGAPAVRDPTVLSADNRLDDLWHLWADSPLGIDHYTSPDGLRWSREDLVAAHAMGAHVRLLPEGLVMMYTRGPIAVAARGALPFPARAELVTRFGQTVYDWDTTTPTLTTSLPWFAAQGGGDWVSHPCLVHAGDRWKLYFSAGTASLGDGAVPRYVGMAETDDLDLGFVPHPQPVLQPRADTPEASVGAGSLKVFPCLGGGYAGLQTVYGVDPEGAPTASLRLVHSLDGTLWSANDAPLLTLSGEGWARSHLGAVDAVASGDHIHVYFSACGDPSGWLAGSQVGRISARLP